MSNTPIWLYMIGDGFYFARRMRWTEVFFNELDDGRDPLVWFAWEAGTPWGPDEDQDYLVYGLRLKKEMLEALFEKAYDTTANGASHEDGRQWRLPPDLPRQQWETLLDGHNLKDLVAAALESTTQKEKTMSCEHPNIDVLPQINERTQSTFAYAGVCADCGAVGPDAPTVDEAAAGFFAIHPSMPEVSGPDPDDRPR